MRLRNLQQAAQTLAIAGLCAIAGTAFTDEVHEEISLKIVVDGEVETFEFEAGDMQEGESQTFWTDSGKRVDVTRTSEGFSLDIDGKTIDVDTGATLSLGDGGEKHIMIHHGGDHDAQMVRIDSGDLGEGEVRMIKIGTEGHSFHFGSGDPAERLLESGALDELDEETREHILKTLREEQAGSWESEDKTVRIKIEKLEHEEEHEH